jgi:3-methyladenine DNA glycosylase AlkD
METDLKNSLLNLLQGKSDPKAKAWWEGYVKESAPFLGVKMADVRAIVHQWHKAHIANKMDAEGQVDLALVLFAGKYTEEKLAGILFLQEILLPANAIKCAREIPRFAELFTGGFIYDWNVCDWFCVKVLGPLIKEKGGGCARRISAWHSAENLWQARASLVAFVPVAENRAYYQQIEVTSKTLIQREERFAKTAVGWILRDISKQDKAFVDRVVRENIGFFSLESLKNATKYFSKEEKAEYKQMLKEAKSNPNR